MQVVPFFLHVSAGKRRRDAEESESAEKNHFRTTTVRVRNCEEIAGIAIWRGKMYKLDTLEKNMHLWLDRIYEFGEPPERRLQGVPSMGRILLDERSQSGPMTATVAEPQGVAARRS